MGWVEQKIRDHQKTAAYLVPLWNSLRDAIGAAVTEFTTLVLQPGIDHSDCRARGKLCVRVQKPGRFVEIYLSESDQTIRIAGGSFDLSGPTGDDGDREICRYRLKGDRSGLELYSPATADNVPSSTLSTDDFAKAALESFLFDPFPAGMMKRLD